MKTGWTMGPYSLSELEVGHIRGIERRVGASVRNLVPAQEDGKRTEVLNRSTHLVQLLGTDVRTVCEAKVDEAPFAQQVLLSECFSLVGGEREGSANLWPPDRLIFPFLA